MRVLVSACLLGCNCKYNGGNNYSEKAAAFLKDKEVVGICPEMLTGLGAPRKPVELVKGHAQSADGEDFDELFLEGVRRAMEQLEGQKIDLALLQSRSPTCGVRQVYDGTFSGRLISGQGMFAAALAQKGIPLLDAEELSHSQSL